MRLHALSIRKIPANPLAPLLAAAAAADPAAAAAAPAWASAAPGFRQKVLELLGGPLAGDELAAEYLLLTCLSSVSRVVGCDGGMRRSDGTAGRGGGLIVDQYAVGGGVASSRPTGGLILGVCWSMHRDKLKEEGG
jgi:hypothetical protein